MKFDKIMIKNIRREVSVGYYADCHLYLRKMVLSWYVTFLGWKNHFNKSFNHVNPVYFESDYS